MIIFSIPGAITIFWMDIITIAQTLLNIIWMNFISMNISIGQSLLNVGEVIKIIGEFMSCYIDNSVDWTPLSKRMI